MAHWLWRPLRQATPNVAARNLASMKVMRQRINLGFWSRPRFSVAPPRERV